MDIKYVLETVNIMGFSSHTHHYGEIQSNYGEIQSNYGEIQSEMLQTLYSTQSYTPQTSYWLNSQFPHPSVISMQAAVCFVPASWPPPTRKIITMMKDLHYIYQITGLKNCLMI